ncbi:hypothetical protein Hamer_G016932, partial [Homarus americanus]
SREQFFEPSKKRGKSGSKCPSLVLFTHLREKRRMIHEQDKAIFSLYYLMGSDIVFEHGVSQLPFGGLIWCLLSDPADDNRITSSPPPPLPTMAEAVEVADGVVCNGPTTTKKKGPPLVPRDKFTRLAFPVETTEPEKALLKCVRCGQQGVPVWHHDCPRRPHPVIKDDDRSDTSSFCARSDSDNSSPRQASLAAIRNTHTLDAVRQALDECPEFIDAIIQKLTCRMTQVMNVSDPGKPTANKNVGTM